MFAALHIPEFPMVAVLRGEATDGSRPAAVLHQRAAGTRIGRKGEMPLLAVNRAARAAGVVCGWPLNRALVRCPDLRLLERDPAAEAALLATLVGLAEALTPDLEITAEDTVILDLSLRREIGEYSLETIDSNDFEIWQVVAPTPDLALLAVRAERLRGKVVTTADLEPLPVAMLHWLGSCEKDLDLLNLWGLQTIGEFLKLPRQALAERLGPEVGRWHDVLHGKTCRLLRLHRPLEAFVGAFDFEEPVVSLEPLIFTIKRLLQTISSHLAARHLAADRLDLRLVLEGGGELSRRLRFPEPQIGVGGMLPLVQTVLESQQLEAAVVRVEVAAGTTFATAAQREWFGRELPQPERWAETLARLEALLGPGRVGIPVPPASFQPDGFTLRPATGTGAMGGAGEGNLAYRPDAAVPLRRYRPPREVAVASEWRDQRPWPLALLTGPHVGRIVAWRGPFPVSGAWWDPGGAWQRLEWDVQLEDRNLLRLVYQPPERWQLDGNYG
jgi:protein ImuB